MLWHLEHRHTGATCFSRDEAKNLWNESVVSAKEYGVTINLFLVNNQHADFSLLLKHLIMPILKPLSADVKDSVKWK